MKEPKWLTEHRNKAKQNNAPLPSFRHGTSIMIKPKFNFENISSSEINPKVEITNAKLKEITEKEFMEFQKINVEKDKFYYLHQEKINKFIYLNIPKKINEPIIVNIDCDENVFLSFYIQVEKNSKATIIFNKKGSFFSEDIRIITKENSLLDFILIDSLKKENIQKIITSSKKNSNINIVSTCLSGEYKKIDIINSLFEEESNINTTVLYHSNKNQIFDIYTAAIHEAPNTTSNILTKGVVLDKSKALSRGLIKIKQHAPNSKGYEKQEVLILSDNAEADAIPNLEIDNNEVICSHGSSVTNIDKELLFYMTSRGINEDDAKKLLINGFFSPLIDKFKEFKEIVETPIKKAIEM